MFMKLDDAAFERIRRIRALKRDHRGSAFETSIGTAVLMKFPKENQIVEE